MIEIWQIEKLEQLKQIMVSLKAIKFYSKGKSLTKREEK